MRIQFSLCLIATLIFMLPSLCSCNKRTAQVEAPERNFVLGSGGGVSGQYEQYKLFENGRVEWYDFEKKAYVSYKTLSASLNNKIWQQFDELAISNMSIDIPGNFNHYLEFFENNEKKKTTLERRYFTGS